jgi:lipopolysaccharide transport system ATP-binding protein
MSEHRWEVGICGTFDVANYGDLLFPLIAEAELTERLGAVTLHRFSYDAKTPPGWPYEVTSLTALPQMIHHLDGLLIGGGFIVRFDKQVAPGYGPPTPEIHHPTGYWLTPALLALQHDIPVVWNAPGMDGNKIPGWAKPLVEMVLTHSRYVSVRDDPSRAELEHLTGVPVAVVPDTAFGIRRLLNLEGSPSVQFTRLCEVSGLEGPYIVIQPALGVEGFVRFVKRHPRQFRGFRFLALPVGPVLGDHPDMIDPDLPGVVRVADWPTPLLIAELIGRSEAVVGHSYHLFITALASGVPVFTRQRLSTGRLSALKPFETFELPPNGEPDPDWFLDRVGRTAPSALARATDDPLGHHWDRVAAAFGAEPTPTASALNRFWQSLPTLLEDAAKREEQAVAALLAGRLETAERQARLDEAVAALLAGRLETAERQARLDEALSRLAARDSQIEEIMASTSWRLTAPVRAVGRQLRK